LHVHDDEPHAAGGRIAGRGHRRTRHATGADLRARPQAGRRRRDHRLSGRETHVVDHARAHRRRARDLLRHRRGDRPLAARQDRGGAQGRRSTRLVANAGRQGLLHRHRHRGRFPRRAGARRHGLYRGDRRGAALSRRPHRRDLRGDQRHPGHRPGDAQGSAGGRQHGTALSRRIAGDRESGASEQRAGVWRDRGAPGRSDRRPRTRDAMAAGAKNVRRYARRRDALLEDVRPRRRRLHARRPGARRLADNGDGAARMALARFFAENIAVQASGLERSITEGGQSITDAQAALAE